MNDCDYLTRYGDGYESGYGFGFGFGSGMGYGLGYTLNSEYLGGFRRGYGTPYRRLFSD